jgi:hypothetical protein
MPSMRVITARRAVAPIGAPVLGRDVPALVTTSPGTSGPGPVVVVTAPSAPAVAVLVVTGAVVVAAWAAVVVDVERPGSMVVVDDDDAGDVDDDVVDDEAGAVDDVVDDELGEVDDVVDDELGEVVDDVAVVGVVVDGGEVVGVEDDDAPVAQAGAVTVLESNVTAPIRASSRPSTVALWSAVIEARAMTVPARVESTPSVDELPTCQKTLQAWAPLTRSTLLSVAVMRVDPAWKMKTASGFNCASSVNGPVMANDTGDV